MLKNRIRELDDSTRLARIQLIVHCVGDMHCPAHIRYPGNTTIGYYKVDYFGREMRYHTIWDSEIVQRPHPWSFTDLAWLLDRYTEAEQAEITSGTVYDWGRESAAASKCIYDVQPGESIANDFIKKYKPLAESQIAKVCFRGRGDRWSPRFCRLSEAAERGDEKLAASSGRIRFCIRFAETSSLTLFNGTGTAGAPTGNP